ncbi:MAG: protein kinase domain-containing protein [Pseudonocardiaceae bacterium]
MAGHYRVLDRVGSGGMGVVWQARDERLHRLVAVKQLRLQPDLSPRETEGARQRALREARIAARLQHPNAIVVYDVAEHDGEPCLVMEYLPSRSLGELLAEKGCLPVAEVAAIGRQVASALAAAHAAQIVHRDVKPGNILIADGGTAKITDFGVSRAAGDVTVTQTGMMAGTPAYLAPEVARGQTPTPASDVFSLGATLFAAVEGRAPFGDSENQLALLHAVAAGEVAPPRNAGPLTPTLMSLLAKDPAARPDMYQASRELASVMSAQPVYIASPTALQPDLAARAAPPPTLASRSVLPLSPLLPPEPVASPDPVASPEPVAPAMAVRPPAPSTAASSAPPAARSATRPVPELRRRAALLAGAVLMVIVAVGIGGLVLDGSSQEQAGPSASAPAPAPSPPPSSSPEPAPSTSPRAVESTPPPAPQAEVSGEPIGFSAAGQLVIDYYNGLDAPSSAWQLLSSSAQAAFGSEAEFTSYWSQYSSVSAEDASGVTENGDGSVTVPVTVIYNTEGGSQSERQQVRVTRLDGRLLIDSDPR